MPRVAKPRRLLCFWSMLSSLASANAPAQMVDEVDARDEADELAVLLEHRDVIPGEDRQQVGEGCVWRDGLDLAHHGATHRLGKGGGIGVDGDQQVGFVDDADEAL